jgi:hypothetical protein
MKDATNFRKNTPGNELVRSSIYIPYLLDYETKLIEHIENFGGNDYSVPLPFTMKNVYDHLLRRRIQDIPQHLRALHDLLLQLQQKLILLTLDSNNL